MTPIRALLADDERPARARLRRLLKPDADVEIVAESHDGPSTVAAVREHAPDLLFLDINMPGLDGFGVLDALGADAHPPAVVFVTAYDQHAIRAFEACALDYLLKPTSTERLQQSLARARQILASPPRPNAAASGPNQFVVRSGNRVRFVSPVEIDWVEAAGNYAILHAGQHNHMIRETMAALEARLAPVGFARVSRSAIVNLHRVRDLNTSGRTARLLDGQEIGVTRSTRELASLIAAL